MGERAATNLLSGDLLFLGKAKGREEKIDSIPNLNLNYIYLPLAPDATIINNIRKLT